MKVADLRSIGIPEVVWASFAIKLTAGSLCLQVSADLWAQFQGDLT